MRRGDARTEGRRCAMKGGKVGCEGVRAMISVGMAALSRWVMISNGESTSDEIYR